MQTRSSLSIHGPALQPLTVATAANAVTTPQTAVTTTTVAVVLVTTVMISRLAAPGL